VAVAEVHVAGRVSAALAGGRSDAALIAEAAARAFETPEAALGAGADARMLRDKGMAADIAYCALVSKLDSVPVLSAAHGGVATVVDGALVASLEHGDAVEV
jgi:phosphosulfolactate phosphohydrolase-like enzyme